MLSVHTLGMGFMLSVHIKFMITFTGHTLRKCGIWWRSIYSGNSLSVLMGQWVHSTFSFVFLSLVWVYSGYPFMFDLSLGIYMIPFHSFYLWFGYIHDTLLHFDSSLDIIISVISLYLLFSVRPTTLGTKSWCWVTLHMLWCRSTGKAWTA